MTVLEKRLIALSALGITIEHADGHRWIECHETVNGIDFNDILSQSGIYLNNKIYGGVIEALDYVDEALAESGNAILEEWYDSMFCGDFVFDVHGKSGVSRVRLVEKGRGGLM